MTTHGRRPSDGGMENLAGGVEAVENAEDLLRGRTQLRQLAVVLMTLFLNLLEDGVVLLPRQYSVTYAQESGSRCRRRVYLITMMPGK